MINLFITKEKSKIDCQNTWMTLFEIYTNRIFEYFGKNMNVTQTI